MSEFRLSFPACVIAGTQKLSANDILLPPFHTFPDSVLTADEVTALPPLDTGDLDKCSGLHSLFVEQPAHSPSDDPRWSTLFDQVLPCRMEMPPPGPDNRAVRWLKVPDSVFLDESHAA